MKLMINIPTDTYNKLMKHKEFYTNTPIFSAITNGIPVSTDGDLISREAVKKAFKESENYHSPKLPNDVIIDSVPTVVVGYLTNCANCEKVEKIRAKRPQGEWIPVSERLPEESLNSVIGWDAYRERCVFVQYIDGHFQITGNDESFDIVAWQPVPEPYMKGSAE